MDVVRKDLPECQVELEITADKETVENTWKTVFKEYLTEIQIPGFRKGKAPVNIVEKKLGDSIKGDVLERLLKDAMIEAVKKYSLNPLSDPVVKEGKADDFERGKEFKCTIGFEVGPEIKIGEYKNVSLERKTEEVTEDDFKEYAKILQERFAKRQKIEDRPAKQGDIVAFSSVAECEGKQVADWTAETFNIEVGNNQFFPELAGKLLGAKVGEDMKIEVNVDPNHANKEVAGKKVVFSVKVKEINEKLMPEINDEFVKENLKMDNTDAMKRDFFERMKKRNEIKAEEKMKSDAENYLSDNFVFEIPKSAVDDRMKDITKNFEQELTSAGTNLAKYLKETNKTYEGFKSEQRGFVKKFLRLFYIIYEIARREKMEITDADVDNMLMTAGVNSMKDLKKRRDELASSGEEEIVRYRLLKDNVLNFIVQNADIKINQ